MAPSRLVALSLASAVTGVFGSAEGTGGTMAATPVDVCNNGVFQSPIDFHRCAKEIEGPDGKEKYDIPLERETLAFSYSASQMQMTRICEADGCYLKGVPMGDASETNTMNVKGDGQYSGRYALDHCILRMPSEHTVHHNHYPLEVQCQHTLDHTNGKKKGTVSFMYEVGTNKVPDDEGVVKEKETNSGFIASFVDKLPADTTPKLIEAGFSPQGTSALSRYYSYEGSQTLGNCQEDVHWYVMYDPTGISQEQLDKLTANMSPTGWKPARALQDLYGRHPEGCHHHHSAASAAALGVLSFALALFSAFAQ